MTKETLINSTSTIIGISRFELRLLDFFDKYCIYLFSFGVNMVIDEMWRKDVPTLFASSPLVRNSIYLFAAINMWPLCDVESLFLTDVQESKQLIKKPITWGDTDDSHSVCPDSFSQLLSMSSFDNLYKRTLEYFSLLLSGTQEALLLEAEYALQDPRRAAELGISGILIFLFLGLHPHKLVPILLHQVEDDPDEYMSSTDFVAICRGVQSTFEMGINAISQTNFRTIYGAKEHFVHPNIKHHGFALITRLERELSEYFAEYDDIVDLRISLEIDALRESIELLATAFLFSAKMNYPVPVFKWPLLVPQHFDQLLRDKHIFALRLYFQFACLCCIFHFSLYNNRNIWRDYLDWFRKYNFKTYGGWFFDLDRSFYHLVIDFDYKYDLQSMKHFGQFDPETVLLEMSY